jgi:hypothetical protein
MRRMRGAWLVLVLLVGTAHADKKLQGFRPDFVREAAGCRVQVNGLTRIAEGVTGLVEQVEKAEKAELQRDLELVLAASVVVKEHCDEVVAVIAFIDANASASYRSVERELDRRYNKIVKLRAASKKTMEELQPTTKKLIPKMARRPTATPAAPKRVAAKFPSGREVELPALPGAWRLGGSGTTDTAEYSERPAKGPAITASATAKQAAGATCEQQRKALLVRADAEGLVDLDLPGAKELGVAWGARYTRREQATAHLVSVLCVPRKAGSLVATADVVPAEQAALADELASLLLRMIAAQKP